MEVPLFLYTIGYLDGFTETQCFLGLVPGYNRILTQQLNHSALGCKGHIGQLFMIFLWQKMLRIQLKTTSEVEVVLDMEVFGVSLHECFETVHCTRAAPHHQLQLVFNVAHLYICIRASSLKSEAGL